MFLQLHSFWSFELLLELGRLGGLRFLEDFGCPLFRLFGL
jgi:hypothetical protein